MKNKKLLFILIPVIIVVLALTIGIVFVVLNNSPEKIFKASISTTFDSLENNQENFTSMKGAINLSADIESNNENTQAISSMLEGSSIGLNMEADLKNFIIKEDLNVTLANENLLNATILLQEQKGYVYLKDWLDKYLELPVEEMDYSELTEYYEKLATLNQNELMEAVEEELILAISKQNLTQEKTTLKLDGQDVNVKASVLSLKGENILNFTKIFITNLKANENFQIALGNFKEDVNLMLEEMLQALDSNTNQDIEENDEFRLSIYTKGFFNEFAGISGKVIDNDLGQIIGLDLFKYNDEKFEFVAYEEIEGEREEAIKLIIGNKSENKNKGEGTITLTASDEQFVLVYSYEKKGNQTSFVLSTEIEGVKLSVLGNVVENGKNIQGKFVISVQEEALGKINLNYEYDFTYDVEVQKVDIQNSVLIDKLSEEDQTTLMTNIQKSKLYQVLDTLMENSIFAKTQDADEKIEETIKKEEQLDLRMPMVKNDDYMIMYSVPQGYEVSEYSSEDFKMYEDSNDNSVNLNIVWESVDVYMNNLEDKHILKAEYYENQEISEVKIYNVNGKEYKLRTITFSDEFGSYINLYFAYKLNDEYCYTVEVESEVGKISIDTIKQFLDITVV